MSTPKIVPLGQQDRPASSIKLADADLGLDNANWSKGLQAMSDWIWSGNLNPVAFPNNLARYFLQIPGVLEQQLDYSTTLIFDEPSFRNGRQVSGFVPRPVRELVINFLGHYRQAWYTSTHHAVLGTLTARKHGIPEGEFGSKLAVLTDFDRHPGLFTPLERAALKLAQAFATNPKRWSDADLDVLRNALRDSNKQHHARDALWIDRQDAARKAWRQAVATGEGALAAQSAKSAAAEVSSIMPDAANEQKVNAQLVELAFLCLQFVALTDVFSALNIPDEPFLADVMVGVLSGAAIERINEINGRAGRGLPELVPPRVRLPIEDIVAGRIKVEPAAVTGTRVPPHSARANVVPGEAEASMAAGLRQVLDHHSELARFLPAYSLPLLHNRDEWRNGTQTAGFLSNRFKQIVIHRVQAFVRARFTLEQSTIEVFNAFLDEYGIGRPPTPTLTADETAAARTSAVRHAENAVIFIEEPAIAPRGTFTNAEQAALAWVERVVTVPHTARDLEGRLRQELEAENLQQEAARVRRVDSSPGIGSRAAHQRLLDHQVAELAMLVGHVDGLARVATILRLDNSTISRTGIVTAYDAASVSHAARTATELRLNPLLLAQLASGAKTSPVSAQEAAVAGEF